MTDMPMPNRAVAPVIFPFPEVEMPQARTITLDNGIPLYVMDQGESEVCRISLMRDGGMEEAPRPAIATLMCDMLCEGTSTYKGADLADMLEFNGAWFNGIAYKHHTAAVMYALNSKFSDVMPLFRSMVMEADFPSDRFMTLRERAASNAAVRAAQVKVRSLQAIRRMVYGESHPLSRVDTPDDISGIDAGDLRRFYGEGLMDRTSGIYLGGRVTPAMEDVVNSILGSNAVTSDGMRVDPRPMAPCASRVVSEQVDGAMQGGVKIAIPTIGPSHPDYWKLSLAVTALGGYFGSRLMLNIREDKGYTYGIQAFISGSGDEGVVIIASEADNAYMVPLIKEVISEIERLITHPVDADEMHRMRNYVISQAVATLDSPFNIMNYYETLRCDNLPADTFRRRMEAVNSITGAGIADMAGMYLRSEAIKIAVAGDVNAYPVDEKMIFH